MTDAEIGTIYRTRLCFESSLISADKAPRWNAGCGALDISIGSFKIHRLSLVAVLLLWQLQNLWLIDLLFHWSSKIQIDYLNRLISDGTTRKFPFDGIIWCQHWQNDGTQPTSANTQSITLATFSARDINNIEHETQQAGSVQWRTKHKQNLLFKVRTNIDWLSRKLIFRKKLITKTNLKQTTWDVETCLLAEYGRGCSRGKCSIRNT